MLRQRLIFGTLLAATCIGLMIFDAWLWEQTPPAWVVNGVNLGAWVYHGAVSTLLFTVLMWLASRELIGFARIGGHQPLGALAQVFAVGMVVGPYVAKNAQVLTGWYDESWGLFALAVALTLAFVMQAIRSRTQHAMVNLATTIFIIFYAGGLTCFLTKLRMEVPGARGAILVLFSIFVVKMNDIGAYFIGRLTGRTKLIEWLSPKKTWEGFFGGLVVSCLFAVVAGWGLRSAGWIEWRETRLPFVAGMLIFGLVMAIFSVAGDLCASLLKRDAAVKDSGQAIPGMGGILDVVDSPMLAAPMAWFFWTRLLHIVS